MCSSRFYCNSKYNVYNPDHFPPKWREKVQDVGFPSKAVTVYSGKKAGFDCKNNYR